LTGVVGVDDGSLDDDTHNDNGSSNEHTNFAAECIDGGANKRKGCDTTNLGHRADNTSSDSDIADAKELLEFVLGEQVTEEGGIESVGGRAAESDHRDQVKLNSDQIARIRGLLEHGLVKSLITDEDLGGHNVVLVERTVVIVMFGNMRVDVLLRDVCHRVQMIGGYADVVERGSSVS